MGTLQTYKTKQEYLTVWLMGCITFLTSISISLVFHYSVVPLIVRQERIISVTGILLFVPFNLQFCFCPLFTAGLSAIIGLCRWRKAPLTLFLLGSIPMLLMLLLYTIPQGIGDLYWGNIASWESIYLADRALLLIPFILLLTSYLFFLMSTIALIGKFWLQRCKAAFL